MKTNLLSLQLSLNEALIKEVNIADENQDRLRYLPCGTYTAQDIHSIRLIGNPDYVQQNLQQARNCVDIAQCGDLRLAAPIDNIYYLISKHEKQLGLSDKDCHTWEVKGDGRLCETRTIMLPDKETMKRLSEEIRTHPDRLQLLAFDTADYKLRYFDKDSKQQEIAYKDCSRKAPVVRKCFAFNSFQVGHMWGKCTMKCYRYRVYTKSKEKLFATRILIKNADGWKTGSDKLVDPVMLTLKPNVESLQDIEKNRTEFSPETTSRIHKTSTSTNNED